MSRRGWPIVIGGCHRSGTSLLRRICNAHSRIHCGPEVKFFRDFYGDYVSDPVGHARFMASARALLPEADLLEVLGGAYVALHERAARQAGKPRWADKSPENLVYLTEWERLLGHRWLLVHVARNPLDTLASIKEIGFPLAIPADLGGRIALYLRYNRAGLDFQARHSERYQRVIYEELVSRPETEVKKLMDWAGERFEPGQLAFNQVYHQPGLEDPKIAQTSGIHRDSVGRWKSLLTPEEAAQIRRDCSALWQEMQPGDELGSGAGDPAGNREEGGRREGERQEGE